MNTLTKTLHMLSNVKRYTAWQYKVIQPYIGKRILEVGCGIGAMTRFLRSNELVVALDSCPEFIKIIRDLFGKDDNVRPIIGDICAQEVLGLVGYKFDTVVCLNVIEHIEDDTVALRNMYRLLQKDGKIVLLVPAIPFIYGNIDRHVGHFRRYTKGDVCGRMIRCGFRIKRCFYFNFVGAIGWFISSKILKKKLIPENQAMCVDRITPILCVLESLFKPLLGLSVIAIGSK